MKGLLSPPEHPGQCTEFLAALLDALPQHIAVVDHLGVICYVNRSWLRFGEHNSCVETAISVGTNYLSVCDRAADRGDPLSRDAVKGIRQVISGSLNNFYLEYPCHSPTEQRWFMMHVSPLPAPQPGLFVISHYDITKRKIAEERISELTRIDDLTGVANRRGFEEHVVKEWQRCERHFSPLCLALIDCDNFKFINDNYGHLSGDHILAGIAEKLRFLAQRPGDLAARYGGDEFILLLSETQCVDATRLLEELIQGLDELSRGLAYDIRVSIGLAETIPVAGHSWQQLLNSADVALYKAKRAGKNRIVRTTLSDRHRFSSR